MTSSDSYATTPIWLDQLDVPRFPPQSSDVECDVAVIGAGITGLTVAYRLKQAGKRVVVVDQGRVGASATGYSTGHLTTLLDYDYLSLLKRIGTENARELAAGTRDAIEEIFRIADEVGAADALRRLPGYLIGEHDQDRSYIAKEYDACREVGLHVRPDAPSELPFTIADGFRIEHQGAMQPGRYLAALARAVHDDESKEGGSRIFEHTRMTRVTNGKRPHTVRTERGTILARDAVVLATHIPPGIHAVHGYVEPMRSYVLAVTLDDQPVPQALFWTCERPYQYLSPFRNDAGEEFLIVGGADTKTGSGHEEQAYRALEHWVRRRFQVKEVRYRWSSQFYDPADGLPIVGRSMFQKQTYIATGFSGDGLTMGTLSARLICDQIMGRSHPLHHVVKPTRFHLTGIAKAAALQWHIAKHWITDRIRASGIKGLDALAPGEGNTFRQGSRTLALYRDESGRVHALDATCPHMKCKVQFNRFERTWDCPCHGSRFDIHGSVLQGPSTKPLAPVELIPEAKPAAKPAAPSE